MKKPSVMLFAAGLGTRLRPHTLSTPKPCLPLLGIPLGYFLLPYLEKVEVENFVVNSFYLPEQIEKLYAKVNPGITFSRETDTIKGSGGGLKQAESLLGGSEDVIVANSDEVFFTEEVDFVNQALAQHRARRALATLVVIKHPEAGKQFGAIWTKAEEKIQRVVGIGREPIGQAEPWHFIGLQIFSRKIFDLIPDFNESNIFYDVLVHRLPQERVEIFPLIAEWYETGNVNDYVHSKTEIQKKLGHGNHAYVEQFGRLKKLPPSDLGDLA